ncbi:MAG: HDOD domain-containing protein [Rubrivivax sp.]|nr:HDOD domain-containing protein [Rubrivivax sp.]
MNPSPARLNRPPAGIDGWAAAFDPQALPVLAETAQAIEDWREHEDTVDAHLLAQDIGRDPLMTLKLLAHVALRCRRAGNEGGGPETVTESLVLMGIGPFFRTFGAVATVEDTLADLPDALAGLQRVLRRSHRAAAFALGFAAHRLDPDAALIHEAALLHDVAELLLWLRAPALALEIAERQRRDRSLRSAQVQQDLLQLTLPALQTALTARWRLPHALLHMMSPAQATDLGARNVLLAVRLARHSAEGWDNPALPDDVADISELLQLGREPTLRLLQDIDSP